MKAALVISWVAIAILVSMQFSQAERLEEVRIKAETAWMETQTMPYVKSYDHRDDVKALRDEIQHLREAMLKLLER